MTPYPRSFRLFCAAVLAPASLFATDATQFCLLDQTDAWTSTKSYRETSGELCGVQPEKWAEPVDFLNGTLHIRLEVQEKPTDLEVMAMFCLWQNGSEICSPFDWERSLTFSKAGVSYFTLPAPGEGDDVEGNAVWGRPKGDHTGDYFFKGDGNCDRVLLQWWVRDAEGELKVLRHLANNSVHSRIDYGPEVTAHIPIAYRIEIYAVAAGAVFMPPQHWESGK